MGEARLRSAKGLGLRRFLVGVLRTSPLRLSRLFVEGERNSVFEAWRRLPVDAALPLLVFIDFAATKSASGCVAHLERATALDSELFAGVEAGAGAGDADLPMPIMRRISLALGSPVVGHILLVLFSISQNLEGSVDLAHGWFGLALLLRKPSVIDREEQLTPLASSIPK